MQAERLRRHAMQEMHAFFSQADVVLGPSFGTPMLSITNFTGQPSLAIRAGFDERTSRALFGHPENETDPALHRVPRSISLWAGLFREGPMVSMGHALESALGMARERPPLA